MRILYNLSIYILKLVFFTGRLFSEKINSGYKGRKNCWKYLSEFKHNNRGKLIWFHCASLGEFEMARPVIDELNINKLDGIKILVTFFSPSGFELRKNYKDVHGVMYMPLDTVKNAKKFVAIAQPFIAVFVKYEFWLNHLEQLKISGSKVILLNGLFRAEQPFFKWYGDIFKEALKHFDHIFLQNKKSKKLLESIGITNTSVTGDLRYDRVVAVSKTVTQFPELETFVKNAFVIVGGSTWHEEEWILKQCIDAVGTPLKLIIAPHDVSEKHLKHIEYLFRDNTLKRFTEMKEVDNPQIVLVDMIGKLSSLYQYGKVSLVGGGFSGALHNIIEPAVFGIPVFFGYKHSKFPEAGYFIKNKLGISIHNGFNFTQHIKELLVKPELLEYIKHKTPVVFKSHMGGTQQVYYKIKGYCKI